MSVTSLIVAPVNKSCEDARQLGTRAGVRTLAAVLDSVVDNDGESAETESMNPPWGTSVDTRHTRPSAIDFLVLLIWPV